MQKEPSSDLYLKQLAQKLLDPIKRGESAFVRWFPGHGKSVLLSRIITDKKLLKENFRKYYQRFIFVKIDAYLFDKSDLSVFLTDIIQNLTNSLNLQKSNLDPVYISSVSLLRKITKICQKAVNDGLEITFVIDAIDDLDERFLKEMFSALEYIVESNRERIHTHINVNKRDILESCVTQSGLLQNIIYISLPDRKECRYFLNYYSEKWNLVLSDNAVNNIFKYCGHDPVLIKESLRLFAKKGKTTDLGKEPTLLLKAKNDFGQLGEIEKISIREKLTTGSVSSNSTDIAKELVEANFWDKKHQIPLLFLKVILNKNSVKELRFDKKRQKLIFADLDLSKKLSGPEYRILLLLFRQKGKIVTRDAIADAIWPKQADDQYSGWAIDKTISRLRIKLTEIAFSYHIITHKKNGFCLEE